MTVRLPLCASLLLLCLLRAHASLELRHAAAMGKTAPGHGGEARWGVPVRRRGGEAYRCPSRRAPLPAPVDWGFVRRVEIQGDTDITRDTRIDPLTLLLQGEPAYWFMVTGYKELLLVAMLFQVPSETW